MKYPNVTSVVTIDGDRWDALAYKAYGSYNIEPLTSANPTVPLTPRLPGGITIYIPILSKDDGTELSIEQTPPWK